MRLFLGLLVLAVVIALVLRLPSAVSDFVNVFKHFQLERLPWLAVAGICEAASLASAALAQRQLLRKGGTVLSFSGLFGILLAATAVADLVPAGAVPATGWQIEQYYQRQCPVALATWAVLGGGFASAVTLLVLLLVGAGIAGLWTPIGLIAVGAFLVAGSAAFVYVIHRLSAWEGHLSKTLRHHAARVVAGTLEEATRYRASLPGGALVFAYATFNWLFDAMCLVLSFVLLGLAVPWHGLLFAFAASQVAGNLLQLSVGVPEGGLVGALVLTGSRAASVLAPVLVYRFISYWAIAGIGGVMFMVQTHHARAKATKNAV